MKFELKPFNRNPEKEEVLADIKATATKLGKSSLMISEYNEHGRWHSDTPIRLFKTWNNAVKLAGLEITKGYNIPIEELFENLQIVWTKLGRQPYVTEIRKPISKFDATVYKRRFKTWQNTLETFVKYINEEKSNEIENIPAQAVAGEEIKLEVRTVGWRLRFLIMQRDNFKCRICGNSPVLDNNIVLVIDHIHPFSKGGKTIIENLQTLCKQCNGGKSNLLIS